MARESHVKWIPKRILVGLLDLSAVAVVVWVVTTALQAH